MAGARIDAIDRQLEALRNRRSALLAREATAERKLRTRRAILLGAWLLANRPDAVELIVRRLPRVQDRATFAEWRGDGDATTGPYAVDVELPLESS